MQHSLTKPKSTSKNTSERMATENRKRVKGTQVRKSFCDEKVEGYLVDLQPVEQGYKSGLVRWSRKLLPGGQEEVILVKEKFLRKLALNGKGPYTWKHRASGLLCSEPTSPRSSVASGIVCGGTEKPWKHVCEIACLLFTSCKLKQCLIYNPYNFFFPQLVLKNQPSNTFKKFLS